MCAAPAIVAVGGWTAESTAHGDTLARRHIAHERKLAAPNVGNWRKDVWREAHQHAARYDDANVSEQPRAADGARFGREQQERPLLALRVIGAGGRHAAPNKVWFVTDGSCTKTPYRYLVVRVELRGRDVPVDPVSTVCPRAAVCSCDVSGATRPQPALLVPRVPRAKLGILD